MFHAMCHYFWPVRDLVKMDYYFRHICLSVCLSVCPYEITSLPLGHIGIKFENIFFFRKSAEKLKSHKNQAKTRLLHMKTNIYF